jgi:hypothetical protein
MRIIKLFGGPRHGHTERVQRDQHRLQVAARCDARVPVWRPEEPVNPEATYTVLTYYVREYWMTNTTEEGARVQRRQFVGLFEGAPLFREEERDLEVHMATLPWQWINGKPNFLKQFDQWFEYTLCEVTGRQPKVRY